MKELYYIFYDVGWGSGILKKIDMHINFFSKHFLNVEKIAIQRECNKLLRLLKKFFPLASEYKLNILDNVRNGSVVYIRYNGSCFKLINKLRLLKKKKCLIYVEIPTYPYYNEYSFLDKILNYKEILTHHLLKLYVDKIITYSRDEIIFGIKTINVSNCIDFERISKNSFSKEKKSLVSEIHSIAVAAFSKWHGYDRVIEGMKKYYDNNPKVKFYFHLVGDGKELSKYENMINKYKLSQYVLIHGKLIGSELDKIYEKMDLGFDALGRHRSGVLYNSSLKGKEYLAKGLPIVSGVNTELDFFKPKLPFYIRVPANDTAIDIDYIIKSIVNLNSQENFEDKIRFFAEKNFDINVVYKKIYLDMNYLYYNGRDK